MTVYVVFHGHVYQPPRESPWTGEIPEEAGAAPFANWNQRITEECYRPNAAARILGTDGEVAAVRDNYRSVSLDVGPTLAHWLDAHAPDVAAAIAAADREHRTAIAHPWVHAILPLCNERDRRTLVRWGVHDFRRRFGRDPEGMWLPETGVDTPTLEALADEGIFFTLLAPHQLEATRNDAGDEWRSEVDPRRPYRITLPSGRVCTVLTYDGGLSNAVAFENVLRDGVALAARVRAAAGDAETAIASVVTDFETYGHHHRFGEMALARALVELEQMPGVQVVPALAAVSEVPAAEARLAENTAWSCAHGLERWRSNCGCRIQHEAPPGQEWRAPLREALDLLRDRVQADEALASLFDDCWRARDDYGAVLTGETSREDWLAAHASRAGDAGRATTWITLQLHLLSMYTSCGWFFDDAARLETVLVLRHAARALELIGELGGPDLEPELVELLRPMRSADPRYPDGAAIWELARAPI